MTKPIDLIVLRAAEATDEAYIPLSVCKFWTEATARAMRRELEQNYSLTFDLRLHSLDASLTAREFADYKWYPCEDHPLGGGNLHETIVARYIAGELDVPAHPGTAGNVAYIHWIHYFPADGYSAGRPGRALPADWPVWGWWKQEPHPCCLMRCSEPEEWAGGSSRWEYYNSLYCADYGGASRERLLQYNSTFLRDVSATEKVARWFEDMAFYARSGVPFRDDLPRASNLDDALRYVMGGDS